MLLIAQRYRVPYVTLKPSFLNHAKKRKRWVNEQKKTLKAGKIVNVIHALKNAAEGSKSKNLKREVQYFIKNQHRFAYDQAKALGLPIGSGAIESAIRRVVNLRLKSPCLYWNEDTAMSMLLLRSYYNLNSLKM